MVEQLSVKLNFTRPQLEEAFGQDLEFDKELGQFTTYKTGGPAKFFLRVRTAESGAQAIKNARKLNLPYFLVGGGSNLLIADCGYDGLIIKVDIRGLKTVEETNIFCGAGENLMGLIDFAADKGLAGLEFAAGIFGSVGGAIYGNAGAYGGEIGDIVKELTLVDKEGNVKSVDRDHCQFSYRDSALKRTGEVVIDTLFELKRGDKKKIKERIEEILAIRSKKHPVDGNSAGSFFKNIPDPKEKYGKLPAGRLLEEAGCKGLSVGGARVFEKHANIIVNTGGAKSGDIRKLADLMKQKVYDKFGITLEEEVIQLGQF